MIEANNSKTERLQKILGHLESVLVSFSGGVDSALLLCIAAEVLGMKAKAVTFTSPIFSRDDLARAENFAAALGVAYKKIPFPILSQGDFLVNNEMRCRICKRLMVEELKKEAAAQGMKSIVDGTNQDDLTDYRPGLAVLRRAGIRSPLMEAGFTKNDIRLEANRRAIEFWDVGASACLASRIAYGIPIREADLTIIDQAEAFLRDSGFTQVRVRYHPSLARIEVSPREIARAAKSPFRGSLLSHLKTLGFHYVTLDLAGYRSGSMNELFTSPLP
ncbi:MAG: ATP-dependent sacrificial sulfur transferase LarE [Thermodesulfobacteriota bacterium]